MIEGMAEYIVSMACLITIGKHKRIIRQFQQNEMSQETAVNPQMILSRLMTVAC